MGGRSSFYDIQINFLLEKCPFNTTHLRYSGGGVETDLTPAKIRTKIALATVKKVLKIALAPGKMVSRGECSLTVVGLIFKEGTPQW